MRASRVNAVTSSIFRNERQYLQSNELFHRVMQDGNGQMPNRQQPQQQSKKKNQHQPKAQPKMIRNSQTKVVQQNMYLDGEVLLEMQSRLLQHSTKINRRMNTHARIRTYRTSV